MDERRISDGYEARFGRLAADEWARVIGAFDDAVIYQTREYGAERWGARNLSHVVVTRGGEPAAAAQVAEAGAPRIGLGICYVPWGPMFRPRGRGPDTDALRRILGAMLGRYCRERGLCLRLRPQAFMEGDEEGVFAEEGYGRLASAPAHRTLVMDCSLPLEEIRRGTKRTYRQHLKRAMRCGLEVVDGSGPELYGRFMELYGELKARKGFSGRVDPAGFAHVQRALPEGMKMKTTVCLRGDEAVSALVTSAIGDTAIGIFAASSPKGRETCASYLMWWRALEAFKAEGRRWLDMGGIDPEAAPGPARFKSRLAGKTGREVRHPGQFEAAGGLASRVFVGLGSRLREALRRLASAGRRLRAKPIAGSAPGGTEKRS